MRLLVEYVALGSIRGDAHSGFWKAADEAVADAGYFGLPPIAPLGHPVDCGTNNVRDELI